MTSFFICTFAIITYSMSGCGLCLHSSNSHGLQLQATEAAWWDWFFCQKHMNKMEATTGAILKDSDNKIIAKIKDTWWSPSSLVSLRSKPHLKGGDKQLLDRVAEELQYHIVLEWVGGLDIVEILTTFKDVTLSETAYFTKSETCKPKCLMRSKSSTMCTGLSFKKKEKVL